MTPAAYLLKRIGLGAVNGQWDVEAFARNVTDETYYVVIATQPLAGLVSGGGPAGRVDSPDGTVQSVWGLQFSWRGGN